jgi:hypothetical protein
MTDEDPTDTSEETLAVLAVAKRRSVGFANPPVASRWKKGQSGNPSGRPKRQHIVKDALRKALSAAIRDPRHPTQHFSQMEYLIQTRFDQAIQGNDRAAAQIFNLAFSLMDEGETVPNPAHQLAGLKAELEAAEAGTGKLPPPGNNREITGREQGKKQGTKQVATRPRTGK